MHAVSSQRNRLLGALSRGDLGLLQEHFEPVTLKLRLDLEKPNRSIEDVYFPESGFASVVAVQANGAEAEVGLIGCEGMTGIAVVLGNHRTPHATYIQAAGEGQRIRTEHLRDAMKASEALRNLFLKYVQAFHVQTAHTAIANVRAKLDERLARWILMAQDRIGDNTLPLTHEFLALMLGVRRAGVTEALQILRSEGLIKTAQGQITVLNRKGIERKAGRSYGVPEAEYRRLMD
jgi:CRP-like cAMP-binding protein